MNRRQFLTIAGSTAVILAAGGTSWVATRTPHAALKPWKDAGSLYADPMRRALSFAILAPNPHNRQPWVVDLKSKTEADLFCDLDRRLPETDPFDRQIAIGMGCFLELFAIAASDQGHEAGISIFPEGEPGGRLNKKPIARLTLTNKADLTADPLFAHVLTRHTNRNSYDTGKLISDKILRQLQTAANSQVLTGGTNNGKTLDELRKLTRDAMTAEMRTPGPHKESVDLMRIGRSEVEADPDGISMSGAFLETLSLAGILTRRNLANPNSGAFKKGIEMMAQSAMTSMGFVWINTRDNGRESQIEAGRAYMRIALQAAAAGLAMQPMSQALQEYSAMAPYYKTVHNLLADAPDERVQMLARIGYAATKAGPAPRWPLTSVIKES